MGVALRSMGAALTDEELSEAMIAADDDGDGKIDFNEFRRSMKKRLIVSKKDKTHIRNNVYQRIINLFHSLDNNRNGEISSIKFKLILTKVIGISLTKREWSSLKDELDLSGNSMINEDQLYKVWSMVNVPPSKKNRSSNDRYSKNTSERWYVFKATL